MFAAFASSASAAARIVATKSSRVAAAAPALGESLGRQRGGRKRR